MEDTRAYGFHSLRAGAATQSAREGVPEQHIKLHGNWRSGAVQAYIRPDTEERLRMRAIDALAPAKLFCYFLFKYPSIWPSEFILISFLQKIII